MKKENDEMTSLNDDLYESFEINALEERLEMAAASGKIWCFCLEGCFNPNPTQM